MIECDETGDDSAINTWKKDSCPLVRFNHERRDFEKIAVTVREHADSLREEYADEA